MLELFLCWIFLTMVGILFIAIIFILRMIFGIPTSWKRPILVAQKKTQTDSAPPKKMESQATYVPINETKVRSSGNGYYDDELGWRFHGKSSGSNSRGSQGKA